MIRIFSNVRAEPRHLASVASSGNFQVTVAERELENREPVLPEEHIIDTEILFCDLPPVNLDKMLNLKFIQLSSVGTTQLDGLNLGNRGIRISNAQGVFDVPIAEWNIAMMIHLLRDIRGMFRNQDSGTWDRDVRFQKELRGATVGIWGYGGIGRETARLGKALGLTIHTLTRSTHRPDRSNVYRLPETGDPEGFYPDQFFTPDKTTEFLSGLDFLILAMPLTPENTGLIGEKELAALPSHACVLNPARGPLIQEEALLHALENRVIAGAALDTHYHYPMPPEHPLWQMPNVIMTPHISGSDGSPHFLDRIWDIFSQNVRRYAEGATLLNETTVED